jgi:hypothetical protein
MLIDRRDGSVEPDYFQFYLKASNADHASDQVTGEGYETHLEAPSPGFVYVGTLKKFLTTPVRVEVHDTEPVLPGTEWQHVAEVSLTSDGVIDVLSWPGDVAFSIPTPDGSLRLRVMWAGLEPGLSEGIPEEGPGREHLELQLWPAPRAGPKVLRWWSEWKLPPISEKAPDGRRQIEGVDEVVRYVRSDLRLVPVSFVMRGAEPAPPLPGGLSGHCVQIWGDPRDGTWWVDGYDVRRTLRVATEDEVRNLVRQAKPVPPDGRDRRPAPAGPRCFSELGLLSPHPDPPPRAGEGNCCASRDSRCQRPLGRMRICGELVA